MPVDFASWLSLRRLLLLGLLLRLSWALLCPNEPTSDQAIYDFQAGRLAAGLGYTDAEGKLQNYWPVGYSALLAPAYAVLSGFWATVTVNTVFWLFGIAGTYKFTESLFDERAGLLAALVVAVHPTFVMHTTLWASETPFCAVTPWILWQCVRIARDPGFAFRDTMLVGALIGLLVYVRPPALLFLGCVFAFGWIEQRTPKRALAQTLLAGTVVFAILLPWGLRNQEAFGRFALTSFNGGINLWMGNNPQSDGGYMPFPDEFNAQPIHLVNDHLQKEAIQFITSHPVQYVSLCLRRLVTSLRSDTIAAGWNEPGIVHTFGPRGVVVFKVVCSLAHWGIVLLAVWRFIRLRRSGLGSADAKLSCALLLLSVPFVLIVGGNRYMLPIVPVLCVWFGAAASLLLSGSQTKASTPEARHSEVPTQPQL